MMAIVKGTKIKGPQNWSLELILLFESFKVPIFRIFNIKLHATSQKVGPLNDSDHKNHSRDQKFGIFYFAVDATFIQGTRKLVP